MALLMVIYQRMLCGIAKDFMAIGKESRSSGDAALGEEGRNNREPARPNTSTLPILRMYVCIARAVSLVKIVFYQVGMKACVVVSGSEQ